MKLFFELKILIEKCYNRELKKYSGINFRAKLWKKGCLDLKLKKAISKAKILSYLKHTPHSGQNCQKSGKII